MKKQNTGKCEFCAMADNQIPCDVVLENEYVLAILDPNPVSSGSMVVTTKKHYTGLDELDEPTAAALMNALQASTRAIKKVFDPDGIGMLQNSGKVNSALHFHIHVFPRYHNDWFRGLAGDFVTPTNVDAAETAAALKKAI